jgi:ComF family protein
MRDMWNALLDLVYPALCPACDARLERDATPPWCAGCAASLEPLSAPHCVVCGEPFDSAGPSHICRRCVASPPAFDEARAPLRYGGALADALLRYKHGGREALGGALARCFAAASLAIHFDRDADVVVPVPLHPTRLAQRGFDQAARLARAIARAKRLPLLLRGLRRIRATPPQTSLSGRARRQNVTGAFAAAPRSSSALRDRRVLLVDDVLTTGATASACAHALRAAGAARVYVLTLARASHDEPGRCA